MCVLNHSRLSPFPSIRFHHPHPLTTKPRQLLCRNAVTKYKRPYTSVMIVPTGIGASIGGFAGDALPVARALASVVDCLISHPNVLNAAMLYWPRDNVLYVEGHALDRFAEGLWCLKPVHQNKIVLGSSSVARKAILAEMGYQFSIMTADIDEKSIRTEKPEELVMALAEAKADALVSKLQLNDMQEPDDKPTLLITADTVVVYEGMIREKPASEEEARRFIKGYSDGYAETVTSVVVVNLKTRVRKGEWDKVEICFNDIPVEVIESLIEEGKVLSVAGALIIEHPLVLPSIKKVVGGTDSVMGLPKALTQRLIMEALL